MEYGHVAQSTRPAGVSGKSWDRPGRSGTIPCMATRVQRKTGLQRLDFEALSELESRLRAQFPSITCFLDHCDRMPEFIEKACDRAEADLDYGIAMDARLGLPTNAALHEQRERERDAQALAMFSWVKVGVIVGVFALVASIVIPLLTTCIQSRNVDSLPAAQTQPAEP